MARRPPAAPRPPAAAVRKRKTTTSKRPPAEPEVQELFGKRVKAAREAAGLSQTDLARLAGIHQSKLPAIEGGRTDVRISTLRRLARALGISLHSLLPPT